MPSPSADLLLGYCRTASFYSIKSNAFYIESAFSTRICVFLVLRRFIKVSFALRRVRIFSYIKVILQVRSSVLFANCLTVIKILIDELLWCLVIYLCIYSDCERVFVGLYGVQKTYRLVFRRGGPIGVGVCNLMSSFDKTAWRLYGIRLAPRKLP